MLLAQEQRVFERDRSGLVGPGRLVHGDERPVDGDEMRAHEGGADGEIPLRAAPEGLVEGPDPLKTRSARHQGATAEHAPDLSRRGIDPEQKISNFRACRLWSHPSYSQ